ncbi:MAG TPA: hypothetical protein VIX17_07145 [Pyrinomonadaceae bacterium]|jgi:hypothetical protein
MPLPKAPQLPQELLSLLSEKNGLTPDELNQIISQCRLCHRDAVYPVIALAEGWNSKLSRVAFYGLCEECAELPNITQVLNKEIFESPALRQ